jgi:hypothetical protein
MTTAYQPQIINLSEEAKNVLNECHTFNYIKSSSNINEISPDLVTFTITIIEENSVEVELSRNGYKILSALPEIPQIGNVYESIEMMLGQVSKEYLKVFNSHLFEKLSKLSSS